MIKMAPIMVELAKRGTGYNFIFTGQHRETMEQLRENFEVKEPDVILHTGKDITGILQMFLWILKILFKTVFRRKNIFGKINRGDIALVHGDTFSALLGALMGRLAGLKVGHVEAGLRSFNIFHPFPEEITRLLTFSLSDYYFCPGEWAVNNLEKFKGVKINTGMNTLYDSLKLISQRKTGQNVKIPKEKFCICSIHRFENIFRREKLRRILDILKKLTPSMKILFILHPPTEAQLKKYKYFEELKAEPNIELRKRYDYADFIYLLDKSKFLITDGGSNQEECHYLGKPCLLLREATERKEGIETNVVLSRFDKDIIDDFFENYEKYRGRPIDGGISPSFLIAQFIL